MNNLTLPLVIAAIVFQFDFTQCFACRCQKKPSVKNQIKTSEMVVTGTILSKETIVIEGLIDNLPYKIPQAFYKILVLEKHKGNFAANTLTIQTTLGDENCGFDFKIGGKYLIYSSKDQFTKPGNFSTSICTRTRKFGVLENLRIKAKIKK